MGGSLRWTTDQLDDWAKRRKLRLDADCSFDADMASAQRQQALAVKPVPAKHTHSGGILYPLVQLCIAAGLPEPIPEYRFHNSRGWRFDYAWPNHYIACEVEGGIWMKGGSGHSHPMHI